MKILVVCQYYYPENFQINDICEELVNRGHSVTVLTGLPNYPTGIIPDKYKNIEYRNENVNGVDVIRCFEIGRKKGAIGLALNYISYCLSANIKVKKIDYDYDLIFVYQLSPILMALPGCRYKKKHKIPMLLYCCDLWPESMKLIIKNEKSFIFRLVKRISTNVYRSSDKIIAQTKYFYQYFKTVHGITDDKLCCLPQFANDEYLKHEFYLDNGIIDFAFLGNIGIAQELGKVIEAVNQISEINGFQLHIVGDGSCLADLKKEVANKKLESKIRFYGRRPVEEMAEFYKLADVCLVSLSSENMTGLTLPSKVQGYMAAGKMVLGMINGATSEVINTSKCGICVSAGDSEGLANAMKDIIENPNKYQNCGKNGRQYFKEHFSKEKFMDSLENIIIEMVEDNHVSI